MNKNFKKQTLAVLCATAAMVTVAMAAPPTSRDSEKAVSHSANQLQNKKSDRITAYRVENKNDISILFATIDGEEKLIARDTIDQKIIEDGKAIVWIERTHSGFEGGDVALWRFDAKSKGKHELLVTEGIASLREVKGKSGRSALVLGLNNGSIDYPIVALVDPQRGETWEQRGALLTDVRNGRLAVAVYRQSDIINKEGSWRRTCRPKQMLYPDIDTLRQRPVLKRASS